jgi:hypothetical protein
MTTKSYSNQLRAALLSTERRVFVRLKTPQKIQDFLDSLSINFERGGEILIYSPRTVLKKKKAHCIEGALLAAAALAYYGREPLLLDFQTTNDDEDHVVAIFKQRGLWGALSKTNHPVLRYRDPVYKTIRELAMSYFHEYYLWSDAEHAVSKKELGKKTLRAYSAPFNLMRYKPERWVTTASDLDWLAVDLDNSRHFSIASKQSLKLLRPASKLETTAMKLQEWKPKRLSS